MTANDVDKLTQYLLKVSTAVSFGLCANLLLWLELQSRKITV